MQNSKKLNIAFSIARVFAIISVIAAHITFSEPHWVYKMINAIGSIGVVVFIILSGYFYKPEKYDNIFGLIKDKFKSIVIPWVLMGSLAFLSGAIVTNSFSIKRWVTYILGYNSFLYYLPMLFLCYLIFFKQSKLIMLLSGILTVASVYCTAFGFIDNIIKTIYITNYLNILNWVGYFALGCVLRKVNKDKLYNFIKKSVFVFLPAAIIIYVLICVFDIKTGYFSFIGMPYQIISAFAIFSVSLWNVFDKKIMHIISNMTFTVYLVHIPLIGLLDVVFEMNILTKLLSPVFILAVTVFCLYIGYLIAKLIKLDKIYCRVAGLRIDRDIKSK